MSTISALRGHPIEFRDGEWKYIDTGHPTISTWHTRGCGHCNQFETTNGHDACLGTIKGASNACCGHGDIAAAYVQFDDGSELRGHQAMKWFAQNLGGSIFNSLARIKAAD